MKQAEKTKAIIDKARVSYEPIANRVAALFFCISDLAQVDPMYQYSLEWYINLFLLAVSLSSTEGELDDRVASIIETHTKTLYVNVCRSLFEKDKVLFSFLLTKTVMLSENKIDSQELRYFLAGNTAVELAEPNPVSDGKGWLKPAAWKDIVGLKSGATPRMSWLVEDLKNVLLYMRVSSSRPLHARILKQSLEIDFRIDSSNWWCLDAFVQIKLL